MTCTAPQLVAMLTARCVAVTKARAEVDSDSQSDSE